MEAEEAPTMPGGLCPWQPRPREDHPLTTRRAAKPHTSTNKAKEAPIGR